MSIWESQEVSVPIFRSDVDSTGWKILSEGAEATLTKPTAIEVLSSNPNDSSAGSGSQAVGVAYLDASLDLQVARVDLAGTNPVAIATASGLLGLWVTRSGGQFGPAGTLSVRAVSGGEVYGVVTSGRESMLPGFYAVPRHRTAVLGPIELSYGSGNVGQDVLVEANVDPETGLLTENWYVFGRAHFRRRARIGDYQIQGRYALPPGAVIRLRALGGEVAGSTIAGTMTLLLGQQRVEEE